MTDSIANRELLDVSLRRPVWMMIALFVIALLLKLLDTFVLPFNAMVGELIFSKLLGFALVVLYVWLCGRKLRDIGLRRTGAWKSVLIGIACVSGLFAVAYGIQLVVLRATGEEAALAFSAVDPKTGLEGGWLFALWLIATNFVNSAMEEGLFRGAMLRHFLLRLRGWGAILLQALFFAVWHLNWPAQHLLSGQATIGEALFEAAALLLATGIAGIVYGYLYYKTGNL
jgi:membrane protease YdiL (CAAX protease family)